MDKNTYVTGECTNCGAEIRVRIDTASIYCLKCMNWSSLTVERIEPEIVQAKK